MRNVTVTIVYSCSCPDDWTDQQVHDTLVDLLDQDMEMSRKADMSELDFPMDEP